MIYIVVCEDRRTDPEISVHRTPAGADARFEEHMSDYGNDYEWTESLSTRGWVRYARTDSDDGPGVRIEEGEMEE